jgi:hypothetical protein
MRPRCPAPEQPRRLEQGGPRGATSLAFFGGGILYGGELGLGLVLRGGAGPTLLLAGGEVEVGAHDVGDAGRRLAGLA